MKKLLCITFIIIGILLLITPIFFGTINAILGKDIFCFMYCDKISSSKAFINSFASYSFVFWPTYLVGIIMIIVSTIVLKKK